MPTGRLLSILLVLLQSGLTVAHAHSHTNLSTHTQLPHLHACELLELFTSAHHHDQGEGEDHDADAVDLSDVIASAEPPASDSVAVTLAPVETAYAVEVTADHSFPLGLPPSTAGPQRPLYLILCTLTI
jgi:hypothetical protein